MDTFLKLYVLQNVRGIGHKTIFKLDRQKLDGIETGQHLYELVAELGSNNARIKTISIEEIMDLLDKAKKIAEKHDRLSIRTIHLFDKEYPDSFKVIPVPPIIIFAKGNISSLKEPGIAVIGTRNISPYAQKVGQRIGEIVAENGLTVISGLATGCDTAGHVGCLRAGGTTIAIVATPLDQTYPEENIPLEKQIIENNGCVISEYPVGTPVSPYYFIQRDRLQCGLANGVIVVETGHTGGTWHAINGCKKIGKPLGCFSFTQEHYSRFMHSIGNKQLIEKKEAVALYDKVTLQKFLETCNTMPPVLF